MQERLTHVLIKLVVGYSIGISEFFTPHTLIPFFSVQNIVTDEKSTLVLVFAPILLKVRQKIKMAANFWP